MNSYVLGFQDVGQTKTAIVGGKGANLGELSRIEGIHVPPGFCISTHAFQRIIKATPVLTGFLATLSLLRMEDRDEIRETSGELRTAIERTAIPQDIKNEIARSLSSLDAKTAYAVRSSATAEDLPTASFAGQQDTYLNVIGEEAILKHIRKCWASLFTERAVIYRLQNGFDHRSVHLAVVVQQMVFPEAAGILFTADPVTSNRKVLSIDAGFGLGEAMVSGQVNPDTYKVRDGRIIEKQVSTQKLAIYASQGGGTHHKEIELERRNRPTLTDAQILQLERIGRQIEEHFGQPQDVEWCLADDMFYVVQSRPITTLYPIPRAGDQENHVYVSVGHQQMMTDPIKPLGLSFFLMTTAAPMRTAGGRLFVDITRQLASPASRQMVIDGLGKSDPLIKDALLTVVAREDFLPPPPPDSQAPAQGKSNQAALPAGLQPQPEPNGAVVSDLIMSSQASLEELQRSIQTKSGVGLFDFIIADIPQLKQALFGPRSMAVVMAAMQASAWLNENMEEWLGEKSAADTLSQAVPNNITAQMGLALLDVADVIRPYPAVIDFLQRAGDDHFLDKLAEIEGGQEARAAIGAFLNQYGMRCPGEIDITRTRWRERPAALIPLILNNINNFEPGARARKFEQGRREALAKEQDLLDRLRQLPGGEEKAAETRQKIGLLRNLVGYREYPKYVMVSRYFVYKQALVQEAERLRQAGVIRENEDIYYLTFEELRETVRTQALDGQLITRRQDDYKHYATLTPPRVITSDGEIVAGAYKRENLPAGSLAGLAVSSGVVEGRARVILHMQAADLQPGDILVTTFTDPSWTPLFVSIKGLVTEVGGLMTHGAVIAREYGLPAVVGVEHATTLIKDGQRIRVHGTEGYVELL